MVARRLLAAALAVAALAAAATALAASPRPRPGPPPRVFAFLSRTGGDEMAHLRRYGSRISVLAPNWYALQPGDLTLHGGPTPSIVALAAAEGVAVWPVVDATLPGEDPFAASAARTRVADEVAGEAAARNYAGMTLDIEQLPPSARGSFTAFVQLLAARLHAAGERLAVYVPRHTPGGRPDAYAWPALARAADLVIGSGYDEHWSTGRPGPVTSAAGFTQMLDYAAGVSRTRVAPTIGAFGYSWPLHGGRGTLISTIDADALRAAVGARLHGSGGDAYFTARGRIVHYQTTAALVARARDARDAGFRWLALFSLGREPDAFWARITTARQAAAPGAAG